MSEGLSGRVYLEMDPELRAFLERYVDSFAKVELLRFFHDHPHSIDTAETIASATGRDVESLCPELNDLAATGLIQRTQMGEVTVYALDSSPEVWERLHRFVEASRDHRFRIRLIYYLVRGRDG